jgi:hypothetical protein
VTTSGGGAATAWPRRALVAVTWLFVACLVVQFFLVGLDVFGATGESEIHRDFAYLYGWLAPIIVLLAVAVGGPRRVLWLAVLLLVLYAVQTYLPTIAEVAPMLAAVHAVNALAVFWVAIQLARAATGIPAPGGTSDR